MNTSKIVGFDDAIVGVVIYDAVNNDRVSEPRLVYNGRKILDELVSDGMTYEEAEEHLAYNIESAYVGEGTPLIMWDFDEEKWIDTSTDM